MSPKSWIYLKSPTRIILISVRPLIPVHSKFRKYFFFPSLFFPLRPFQLYADPILKQCSNRAETWFVFLVCVWKGRWGGGGGCKDGGDRDYSDRHDCSHLAFKRQLKPASNIWLSGFCPDLVDDQRMLSTLSRPRPWTSVKAVLITMACGITKTKKRLQLKKKTWNFSTDVVQESESEMTEKGTPGSVWIIEKDIFELGVKNTEKTVKETLGNDWISGGGRGSGGVHWSLGQNSKTKRCRHHRGVPLVMGIFKTMEKRIWRSTNIIETKHHNKD